MLGRLPAEFDGGVNFFAVTFVVLRVALIEYHRSHSSGSTGLNFK